MFSYLRPHHRRTPSNPTSPAESSHTFDAPIHGNAAFEHTHPQRYQGPNRSESAISNALPPSLPAAGRGSSAESNVDTSRRRGYDQEARADSRDSLRNNTRSAVPNQYGSHQRSPYMGNQRPESAGNNMPSSNSSSQHPASAEDAQNRSIQTGRRPTGARLPTPPSASNQASTFEPVQPKSGKARLNLLNPMSLLARRRTPQAVSQLKPEALTASRGGSTFSDTFDPRIKGKFVHDFSAPRGPRRNVSYNDVRAQDSVDQTKQYQRSPNTQIGELDDSQTSPWSNGNHTPVFTEDFEEEQYPAAGPHVRKASDLTDLSVPRPPYAQGAAPVPLDPKSQSRDEEAYRQLQNQERSSDHTSEPDIPPPVPPKTTPSSEPKRILIDPAATPPKSLPSATQVRSRNVSEVSFRESLPKHMKSTSSRFSFDMIGAAEQERLLEDRHRQKALEKKNEDGNKRMDDAYEDDFDYDNMMDDDGLEERIPGVNADLDEDDFNDGSFEEPIPGVNINADEDYTKDSADKIQDLGSFAFHSSEGNSSINPTPPGLSATPLDARRDGLGSTMVECSPSLNQRASLQEQTVSPLSLDGPKVGVSDIDQGLQGLGLQGIDMQQPSEPERSTQPTKENSFPIAAGLDDDDLYFDDGIIGKPEDTEDAGEFDESIFDNIDTDQFGRPLKPLSSLPTLYSPPTLTTEPSPSLNKVLDSSGAVFKDERNLSSAISPLFGGLAPQPSVAEHKRAAVGSTLPSAPGLTQDTLAAYQSALAAAAHQAAASGKFRRDSVQPSEPEHDEPQPGLITDSSPASRYEPFSPSYEMEDDFNNVDAMEDEAIIAAANAEALANDCDGFYGQEFGFYSAPGAAEAEYVNGGFFGPGGDGINRSTSNRLREPNLTPITERSEYSNRNSFMSLSMSLHRPESLASPGLSQLAGMMREEDVMGGDMSLDALLKLRRGAWGGSQASLHSSNGNGSPKSATLDEEIPAGSMPPWTSGPQQQGQRRRNSGYSGASLISDASLNTAAVPIASGSQLSNGTRDPTRRRYSMSSSPTMEVGPVSGNGSPEPQSPTVTLPSPSAGPGSAVSRGCSNGSKVGEEKDKDRFRKHRYKSSAESVSYMKEDDPVTGERWILERRRTAESGEVEVLGRQVVSGGRI